MRRRQRGEVGYFERSRSRFIIPARREYSRFAVYDTEIERGQIITADKHSFCFSGSPPLEWTCHLEFPPKEDALEKIESVLTALVEQHRGRVRLHYSAVASHRMTVGTALATPLRRSFTWALTGWLLPEQFGCSVPLGWSGSGSGLDWLENECANNLRQLIAALSEARMTEAGRWPVVLAPGAAAVLVHEVVGHTVEAVVGAEFDNRRPLGCRIASEVISCSDDPLVPAAPVQYEYDDENVPSLGATPVVQDGIINAMLHSQATAQMASTLSTANGRAASAWDTPIPRVSNLICHPGAYSEDEMIDHVGNGLYVLRLANGINNGAAIKAHITLAEQIKNGKRTGRFVTGGEIEEKLGVLLRAVELGNNPSFNSNAICGRAGQLLFNVGTSTPSIHLSELRIIA